MRGEKTAYPQTVHLWSGLNLKEINCAFAFFTPPHLLMQPPVLGSPRDLPVFSGCSLRFDSLSSDCCLKSAQREQVSRRENCDVVYCRGSNPILQVSLCFHDPISHVQHYLGRATQPLAYKIRVKTSLFFFVFSLALSQPSAQHQFSISLSSVSLFQEGMCSDPSICSMSCVLTPQQPCVQHMCVHRRCRVDFCIPEWNVRSQIEEIWIQTF